MQDRENRELEEGQEVVFTWRTDTNVYRGTVIGFTKKKVRVRYRYSMTNPQITESLKFPGQMIIISN